MSYVHTCLSGAGTGGSIFEKSYDEFTIVNSFITKLRRTYDHKFVITKLRRSYDEFKIINMLIFGRSYQDFMILSYDSYDHK